jgi:tRNA(Ile)-lysidine synthase
MLRRVQKYIRDHGLLQSGDRVLVCVSGGADSMALWDVLQRGGYECVVAHCNFHLRGEESDRDEAYVRSVAKGERREAKGDRREEGDIFVKDFDTQGYAKERGISIEMAARELRYQWFAQLAKEHNCQAIAVAHHQNDQAETVLLNLKRGTGLRGLCGMRPKSENPMGGNVPVIRPLLCTTRDYIEHYLRDIRHIAWVNDSTNTDTTITRNAVRAQLANYSKAEIEHIAATAEHLQGYVDWLEQQDTPAAGKVKLYEQLRPYHFPEVEKIYDALQKGEGGKTFYAPKHKAVIRKGKVEVTPTPNPSLKGRER